MRSSSSVVTPGATLRPTSSSACAASRPATRTFSMISGLLISLPLQGRGAGLSTYSGWSIELGTGLLGDTVPGTNVPSGARSADMVVSLREPGGPNGSGKAQVVVQPGYGQG